MRARGTACAFGYEGCYQKHPASPKIPKRMTEAEAAKVVLPKLPTVYWIEHGPYVTGVTGEDVKRARRWPDGTPMIASDGSGRLHGPKVESIGGNPLERYLADCKARKHTPSEWAIKGRDWKTGEVF